mmetsp:Transcript_8/g.32  ORF Transcript_8/g.32 Transcript_8/m.32 type:complete len:247 (+) Transcript_8:171-911(+)
MASGSTFLIRIGVPTTTASVPGFGTGDPHAPQNRGIAILRCFISAFLGRIRKSVVWYMSVSPKPYTGTSALPCSMASFTNPFRFLRKTRCSPRRVSICSASPPGNTYRCLFAFRHFFAVRLPASTHPSHISSSRYPGTASVMEATRSRRSVTKVGNLVMKPAVSVMSTPWWNETTPCGKHAKMHRSPPSASGFKPRVSAAFRAFSSSYTIRGLNHERFPEPMMTCRRRHRWNRSHGFPSSYSVPSM